MQFDKLCRATILTIAIVGLVSLQSLAAGEILIEDWVIVSAIPEPTS